MSEKETQERASRIAQPLVALKDIVCHPLRVQALIALTQRQASTNELAERFSADKGTMAYHVKALREAKAIEVAETRKGNGPPEHVYKIAERPLMSDEEAADLPPEEVIGWLERILALILADATTSLQSGAYVRRSDHNLIRLPLTLDLQGWEELGVLLESGLAKAMEIEAESAARMVEDREAQPISARFVSMLFEMPEQGSADAA